MIRVLVVDDNPALREMLALILSGEGYEVARARHGGEAVQYIDSGWHPDIVLLDVLMPVMDGLAVCAWIRQHVPVADRPYIVILSASVLPGVDLPADAVLMKPFGVDAMLTVVKRFAPMRPTLAASA